MKSVVINANNSGKIVEFEVENSYNLIREAVDGLFDCIHLSKLGVDMWINDEGKLLNLPINLIGTLLWCNEFDAQDFICGDIILTGGPDDEGYITDLPEDALSLISLILDSLDDADPPLGSSLVDTTVKE